MPRLWQCGAPSAGGTGTYQGAAGSLYVNTKNATDSGNGETLVLQLV